VVARAALRLCFTLCLACLSIALAFAATPGAVAGRAAALRAQVGPPSDALAEDRADFLRRQLLASLERRLDQARALADLANHARRPLPPVPPPASLIALDDLRREQQRLDAELDIGERRRATLAQERDAMARQLSDRVARQRALADANAGPGDREIASLETELTESSVAEIDLTLRFFDLQRELARRQHDANARRGLRRPGLACGLGLGDALGGGGGPAGRGPYRRAGRQGLEADGFPGGLAPRPLHRARPFGAR
jgi:hypothetical protein